MNKPTKFKINIKNEKENCINCSAVACVLIQLL